MKHTIGIIALLSLCALALRLFWAASGVDIHYQSSDGEWADREMRSKGRTYANTILPRFTDYQRRCTAGDVTLERITPMPAWFVPERWFEEADDPRWRVALMSARPKTASGYYPPALDRVHCANQPQIAGPSK